MDRTETKKIRRNVEVVVPNHQGQILSRNLRIRGLKSHPCVRKSEVRVRFRRRVENKKATDTRNWWQKLIKKKV